MLFTSYEFIFFILICFCLYYLCPKKFQWIILLAASYIFYFIAGPIYPIFILSTSLTTYLVARKMDKLSDASEKYISLHKEDLSREERKAYKKTVNTRRKKWMLFCLLFNFGILAVLKYTNFAIDNINGVFSLLSIEKELDYADIILPLGISFYTFQTMGYLLDVYWEKTKSEANFFKLALFISFFPQLIQGPISRFNELSSSLFEKHDFNWDKIRLGLERILWGYFKKMVIADRLLVAVNIIITDSDYYQGAFVLVGMIFYGVELYADFTGGIDITIGIAQVFGIKLAENFNRPFFSKNIAEYWRRWHITMGTWFKDYIFYPLSISKYLKNLTSICKKRFGKGVAKRVPIYIATMITWFTTGIWHGASWNFIMWGLMNGIVILISGEFNPLYEKFHKRFPRLVNSRGYSFFQIVRTFLLMCSLRLFDCYRDVKTAFRMFFSMITEFRISDLSIDELMDLGLTVADYSIIAVGVCLLISVSLLQRKESVRLWLFKRPILLRYGVYLCLFFAVLLFGAYGIGYDASQFIYNQF